MNAKKAADAAGLLVSVAAPLSLYVLTLPRTVVLEDDGLFLMAAAHLGIPHPPGYPLYTLLNHLFMQLPVAASPALLGHLSSAVLGALACGALYACCRLMRAQPVPALTAALLFAASEHFWSQAIIAEVYALNALLLFAVYALVLRAARFPDKRPAWLAAAALYGLSLANHWPLTILTLPGLALAAYPARRQVLRRLPALGAVSLAGAALPYAWMVWRSRQEPLISFRGPIGSLEEAWYFISRQRFSGTVDSSPSADWDDRLAFLQWFGNELIWQLTLPGFALAALGLAVLFRRREIGVALSGVLVFMGNSVVLLVLLNFDFDPYSVSLFRPYSLVCYGLAAVWLAVGIEFLLQRLRPLAAKARFEAGAVVLAGVAGLGMVALLLQANWRVNNRADFDFAERYARMVFEAVPQDSMLLVVGDMESFVLGYYHFVEQRRPDLTLLHLNGIIYPTRLFSQQLPQSRRERVMGDFLDAAGRRVFYTSSVSSPYGRGQRYYGFLREVVADGDPLLLELKRDALGERYFAALAASTPSDAWARLHKNLLLGQYGWYLGFMLLSGDPGLLRQTEHLFAVAEEHLSSLLAVAKVLLNHGNQAHWERAGQYLHKAGRLRDEAMLKQTSADYFHLTGELHLKLGRREAAIAAFRQSWAVYPHPDNPTAAALGQLGVTFR